MRFHLNEEKVSREKCLKRCPNRLDFHSLCTSIMFISKICKIFNNGNHRDALLLFALLLLKFSNTAVHCWWWWWKWKCWGQFCGWQILFQIPLFKLGFGRMNILQKIRRSWEFLLFDEITSCIFGGLNILQKIRRSWYHDGIFAF